MEPSQSSRRGTLFQEGIMALRDAGVENPILDAAVLLGYATGQSSDTVLMDRQALVTPEEKDRYLSLIRRRCGRTAVSRLLGEREFYSRYFTLTEDVLDPRPETEVLVEEAVHCLRDMEKDLRVLDVGTGSGAIAVTVAAEIPGIRVTATDISKAALGVARRNAIRHGVLKQISFVQADLLSGIRGKGLFQAILSNPPYVSSRQYEELQEEVRGGDPVTALVPGPDGTECYQPLAAGAMRLLEKDGTLIVETGDGQADTVAGIFEKEGLADISIIDDLAGKGRVIRGKKNA